MVAGEEHYAHPPAFADPSLVAKLNSFPEVITEAVLVAGP